MKLIQLLEYDKWKDKTIIWEQGEFKIAVDDPDDPYYFTLWTDKNKQIGYLALSPIKKDGSNWMSVDSVSVDRKYQGNRLGLELYRQAMKALNPKHLGIYSYLPNTANKWQVPAIHRRLGGMIVDQDHMFIPRDNNARSVVIGMEDRL